MFSTGIDWSDRHHDLLVIDDVRRQRNASLRVSQTPHGLEKLHLFLETITGLDAKEEMAGLVETSSGLLMTFLRSAWLVCFSGPSDSR